MAFLTFCVALLGVAACRAAVVPTYQVDGGAHQPHHVNGSVSSTDLQPRDSPFDFTLLNPPETAPKPPTWPDKDSVVFPIPGFDRTCASDSRVALLHWRNRCDRSLEDILFPEIELRCLYRAPRPDRCCSDKGKPIKSMNCWGSPWWPASPQQAAVCASCDIGKGPCRFGADAELNSPWDICECEFQYCEIPDRYLPNVKKSTGVPRDA